MTARVIYGLEHSLVDLAAAGAPVKGEALARRHEVSVGFLENILADLRRAGLVQSKRGGNGGYWLARPTADITAADVMRVLDGAGRAEASVGDRLPAVWHTITAATMAAAAWFTLESMAAERVPPPCGLAVATGDVEIGDRVDRDYAEPVRTAAFSFPNPVNEKAARVVAAGVAASAALTLATGWLWLVPLIALGFLARVAAGPRFSVLGRLATQVIAPRLGPAKLVPGPPKRFAQAVGPDPHRRRLVARPGARLDRGGDGAGGACCWCSPCSSRSWASAPAAGCSATSCGGESSRRTCAPPATTSRCGPGHRPPSSTETPDAAFGRSRRSAQDVVDRDRHVGEGLGSQGCRRDRAASIGAAVAVRRDGGRASSTI